MYVVFAGGSPTVKRSSMSSKASAHIELICLCASGYIGCLVNVNGMDVISSKSTTSLGLGATLAPPGAPTIAPCVTWVP